MRNCFSRRTLLLLVVAVAALTLGFSAPTADMTVRIDQSLVPERHSQLRRSLKGTGDPPISSSVSPTLSATSPPELSPSELVSPSVTVSSPLSDVIPPLSSSPFLANPPSAPSPSLLFPPPPSAPLPPSSSPLPPQSSPPTPSPQSPPQLSPSPFLLSPQSPPPSAPLIPQLSPPLLSTPPPQTLSSLLIPQSSPPLLSTPPPQTLSSPPPPSLIPQSSPPPQSPPPPPSLIPQSSPPLLSTPPPQTLSSPPPPSLIPQSSPPLLSTPPPQSPPPPPALIPQSSPPLLSTPPPQSPPPPPALIPQSSPPLLSTPSPPPPSLIPQSSPPLLSTPPPPQSPTPPPSLIPQSSPPLLSIPPPPHTPSPLLSSPSPFPLSSHSPSIPQSSPPLLSTPPPAPSPLLSSPPPPPLIPQSSPPPLLFSPPPPSSHPQPITAPSPLLSPSPSSPPRPLRSPPLVLVAHPTAPPLSPPLPVTLTPLLSPPSSFPQHPPATQAHFVASPPLVAHPPKRSSASPPSTLNKPSTSSPPPLPSRRAPSPIPSFRLPSHPTTPTPSPKRHRHHRSPRPVPTPVIFPAPDLAPGTPVPVISPAPGISTPPVPVISPAPDPAPDTSTTPVPVVFPAPSPSTTEIPPIITPSASPTPSSVVSVDTPLPSSAPAHEETGNPGLPPIPPQEAAPPSTVIFPSPPNTDCAKVCSDPYTVSASCGCVIPIQVGLELGLQLYSLFPLVSELAAEIAAGTFLSQGQVQIMGANAVTSNIDKTAVKANLVPLGNSFENSSAVYIAQRFWTHAVFINASKFGNYSVLYVLYPGLPPSPPSEGTTGTSILNPSTPSGNPQHPIGVRIPEKRSSSLNGGTIAVIVLSCAIAALLCIGLVWFLFVKWNFERKHTPGETTATSSSLMKRPGMASALSTSSNSSASMSFASALVPYTGPAKTFSLIEIHNATQGFKAENIIGEGGFGRVYSGILKDGSKIAVKLLTRDDQQGGREFAAEVEMLSRLHHRNLVKLLGICAEENIRCLVYELIPNGSLESHLHGEDKETSPLDWETRLKIALGAARGLAYLHEDSNPRVIHRDFKASNILLENDFTPNVSDFGLAKTASEEISGHISTRVMGTFGYVAPEYAMTGHLLVKSDVYSYGVVLLELLSGRKPVDMSQPPGQENLVTWARPLLTTREGLEELVDPELSEISMDSLTKVAAIASMCVQPEVSHRPFMGEVVQALKLVYNDSETSDEIPSGNDSLTDGIFPSHSPPGWESNSYLDSSIVSIDYDSGPLDHILDPMPLSSSSALLSNSGRYIRQLSGSFRRHSTSVSGPLKPKSKASRYPPTGSLSEHGVRCSNTWQ